LLNIGAGTVRAGIDWITATRRTIDGDGGWVNLGGRILEAERLAGNDVSSRRWQGYDGAGSASTFVGYRADSSIIRMGGIPANRMWADVATIATNVSRLDVCVTFFDEPKSVGKAYEAWNDVRYRPAVGHRPNVYTLVLDSEGGETLYCGRRISERFGRVYDKHYESRGRYQPGSWRYEIEYKGDAALAARLALRSSTEPLREMSDVVHRQFTAWGISPPWSDTGSDVSIDVSHKTTDDESRLRWLREDVARTVKKLARTHRREEMIEALGLVEAYVP